MDKIALMKKSLIFKSSSLILFQYGDYNSACNRAYYSMFHAARAALIEVNAPVTPEIIRTHRGLINAINMHLIKTGILPKDLGKFLSQAQELRGEADYKYYC